MDERLSLENRIAIELKSYDGLVGIYIDDLKGNVVTSHEKEPFETASTIKLYILAALFERVEKGEIDLADLLEYKKEHVIDGSGVLNSLEVGAKLSFRNVATLMMIVSDNIATNMLIDYLGVEEINECIQRLGCRDTILHNRIDFAKYDKLGTTTPADYASMWIRMAKKTLISRRASEEMIAICKKQHYNTMLTKNLPPYYLDPDNYIEDQIISIASKSGSMDACRNDGGIVFTPYGEYVIVLFHKNFGDNQYYQEHPAYVFGAKISRLIFDQYLALEGRLKL